MPVETWLYFTFGFMILGSIVALEIKDILSAIIAIGIVGLGVSMSFLFLQAPDLAIVQFLFEIFALIILVRAFIDKNNHQLESSTSHVAMTLAGIVAVVAIFLLSIPAFRLLPTFGEPLMVVSQHYLKAGAAETGAANLVSSIILDYRAYDTLGEVTVLFTAILGALAILRSTAKPQATGGSHE
jgi:multicomponent Na+:H+ antiporter subunit B